MPVRVTGLYKSASPLQCPSKLKRGLSGEAINFLIKGIHFQHAGSSKDNKRSRGDPSIDVLSEEYLDLLREAIPYLCELGLNTVLVSNLQSTVDHGKALAVLAEAGLYVLVTLQVHESFPADAFVRGATQAVPDESNVYSADRMAGVLQLVHELAEYPNVLGFVCGTRLNNAVATETAGTIRAGIRDIKKFLRLRGRRHVPVGISVPNAPMISHPALQYFTAGASESRVDFWAPECFSWAYKSSFRISGWQRLVESWGKIPVPMIFSEYGAKVGGQTRLWQEIECLYSPDMTGVFSGGCAYTFFDLGGGYGIVEVDERGHVRPKPDDEFEHMKKNFGLVNTRKSEQISRTNAVEDEVAYEEWVGTYPEQHERRWQGQESLPLFPLDWEVLVQDIRDLDDWEMVELSKDMDSLENVTGELQISE